jgi:hypothetical protein
MACCTHAPAYSRRGFVVCEGGAINGFVARSRDCMCLRRWIHGLAAGARKIRRFVMRVAVASRCPCAWHPQTSIPHHLEMPFCPAASGIPHQLTRPQSGPPLDGLLDEAECRWRVGEGAPNPEDKPLPSPAPVPHPPPHVFFHLAHASF